MPSTSFTRAFMEIPLRRFKEAELSAFDDRRKPTTPGHAAISDNWLAVEILPVYSFGPTRMSGAVLLHMMAMSVSECRSLIPVCAMMREMRRHALRQAGRP